MEVTAGLDMFSLMLGFVRLARGEAGCEGGSWFGTVVVLVSVVVVGGGVVSLVILNLNCSIKRAEIEELTDFCMLQLRCVVHLTYRLDLYQALR